MPRKPRVPSYCHHKPSDRAIVKVKGKIIYLGKYGSDESRDAYARIVADLLAGRPITSPASTGSGHSRAPSFAVADLAKLYLEHAKGYYRKDGKPTSEIHTVRRALEFLTTHHAELQAVSFSIGDLKVVRQSIVDSGVSRGVANKYTNRIVRAFKWAATEEHVPSSVAASLAVLPGLKAGRTDAKETEPVGPVDVRVVDATLPHLPEVVADMVRLQLLTGMRPGEVCRIRPADVDRQANVWEYRPQSHKTEHHGKRRVVVLGPKAQAILTPYLFRDAEEHCFRPKRHIAVPRKFKRYRTDSYRRAIVRACEKAEVPAWSPNQLRHTAGTEIRKQYGLEVAQVILGHSKANVTEIYAERDIRKGREVATLIG
ncbi:tyrosine-type recombinase/integrase [Aeoliella sp.]|uniref:tyrosine-type recombinase/integrase n=1 Tax=Aeoliella sp. TaxID=2795800 RepID=UPI003CCBBF80